MISFPNSSRSYDPDRKRIRFWGHDSAMEVPFFLEENAIFALFPKTQNDEASILEAFDRGRERIFAAAARVYAPRGHRGVYTISASHL